ncbi:hypothetical protein B5X24_HaOG207273 [Helicoverpa armigera]|uniref:Uncharacterized protein n=1 Tax=Helicoverpa armigera TaxID=29058 RepID=A0A2W1BNB6_HELAM|nr:hypothetical protein B5X24_HaOG207273 [Helicoverpa armigera]
MRASVIFRAIQRENIAAKRSLRSYHVGINNYPEELHLFLINNMHLSVHLSGTLYLPASSCPHNLELSLHKLPSTNKTTHNSIEKLPHVYKIH